MLLSRRTPPFYIMSGEGATDSAQLISAHLPHIFTGIAEPWTPVVQHHCILLGLLVSRLADVAVYRSGCTEIVHILTGLCTEVV